MTSARWFFRNWYWFNGVIAAIAAVVLAVAWGDLTVIQRIMLGQFIVLNLHFIEEFRLPGGFPLIANTVEKHSDRPTHYPLNQWTAWAGNNWFAFVVYLPAVIWPDATWLALSVTMFGFLEVVMHTTAMNALLRSWYNPGVATSILGFLPLSIAYLVHVHATGGSFTWWEWVLSLAWPLANYFIVFNWLLVGRLSNRNTRFPFTEDDMARGRRWDHRRPATAR